jgi:hypothetical protein
MRFIRLLFAAIVAMALAGCATGYLLDNQVQSFSQLQALPAPATYRFERSLSQQMDPAQQALEGLADPALHRAGLRRDDAAPRYSVQVTARTSRVLSPYADPWWGGFGGWNLGFGGRGIGLGIGGPWPHSDSYWWHREVTVVLRELGTNRVVYETNAVNDGPWLDNNTVLPAMFDAAMQGFPAPPMGPRRVDVHVGRSS